MVPPSDNLEFFESEQFKKATAPTAGLKEQITDYLSSWPSAGVEFAAGVRELKLVVDGREFAVLYRRTANRLGVMHLYELPQEASMLDEAKARLLKLFGPKK